MKEVKNVSMSYSVPDSLGNVRGIYIIKIKAQLISRFGIKKSDDIGNLRRKLIDDFVDKVVTSRNKRLYGRVEGSSSKHNRECYDIVAESDFGLLKNTIENRFKAETYEEAKDYLSIMSYAISRLPPLYVGMAFDQSIKVRVNQHISGRSKLSEKILSCGLNWSDLEFDALIFEGLDKKSLRDREMIIQSALQPVFSIN